MICVMRARVTTVGRARLLSGQRLVADAQLVNRQVFQLADPALDLVAHGVSSGPQGPPAIRAQLRKHIKSVSGTQLGEPYRLVQDAGDMTIATRLGVPRSTAAGWILRPPCSVVAAPGHDASAAELRSRVARLERRVRRLTAFLRVLLTLVLILKPDHKRLRVPQACDKSRLLRAIDRSRGVLGLGRILRIVGLSAARLNAWRRAAQTCELEDESSCPNSPPHRLTAGEM